MLVGDGVQIDFLCRLSLVPRDMSSPVVMNLLIFLYIVVEFDFFDWKIYKKEIMEVIPKNVKA
jgi:hypothetical protein